LFANSFISVANNREQPQTTANKSKQKRTKANKNKKNMEAKTPFTVAVNENELSISPQQIANFDAVETNDGFLHILKNNKAHRAEIIDADYAQKIFTIKVNGNIYQTKIADKYDRLVKEIGLSVNSSQKLNNIKSPMPGLVLSINVKEGDTVQKGDTLLILEAMKMENVIKAPTDAMIKRIAITQGQAVEKSQLLIELDF
jgi:biotin carboxyl carrier protein